MKNSVNYATEKDPEVLRHELCKLFIKLRAADAMAKAIDTLIECGVLDARSLPADARLDYGTPYKYEFS